MEFTTTEYIIGGIVGVLTIVQVLYLFIVYGATHRRYKAEQKGKLEISDTQPGMSVIITTSDQEEMLAKNLPRILEQDYPDFEVIVVDDNSKDDTKELLERLAKKYPNLYMTHTSDSIRYISHKKLALMLGIKAAKKEWLVFTEPNCYPTSNQWLARMARHFTDDTDVVLGYSNYERRNGFANLCLTYDTLLQQLRMLGLTLCKMGYMGIGRNMAYRKEIFFNNKGYSRHLDLDRGEDDLFINEHVPASRIAAEVSAEATVRCSAANTYEWSADKLSRLFIRRKLHGIQPQLLAFETLSRCLFYAGIVGGIVYSCMAGLWITLAICVALWAVRLGCQLYVYHRVASDLDERRYNVSLPLFDLLQPLWEMYFRVRLLFTSKRAFLRRC